MLYDILVDFPGKRRDGRPETVRAGTCRDLPDDLGRRAVAAGWARPHPFVRVDNKAIATDGYRDAPERRK